MTKPNERHRLSLIIATLGPSTDNEKELITMLMAGIARQWTDGIDIARVLYSDGESVAKNRIEIFREQSKKRNLSTQVYLDSDDENIDLDIEIFTGKKSFTIYTMYLTKKYIEINADYRS